MPALLVDDGQVLVPAVPKDLVNADRPNPFEIAVFESPGDCEGDCTQDRVPLVLKVSATSFQLIRLAQFARNWAYVVVVGLLPLAHGTVLSVHAASRGSSRAAWRTRTSP